MPTSLVLARLGEFFGHRTPWHRRLWNVGTNLALHEVIEYADATTKPESTDAVRLVGLARPPERPPDMGECR